ncbi:hypothetical protein [Acidiphilium rubrum]|nr:hypothetical protein [Acidiphilium rubrum]
MADAEILLMGLAVGTFETAAETAAVFGHGRFHAGYVQGWPED